MSCQFLGMLERLNSSPKLVFLERAHFCLTICYMLSFLLCRFLPSRSIKHWYRHRINYSGQGCRKRLLHLRENDWDTWRVKRLRVFLVQRWCKLRWFRKKTSGETDPVFVQKRSQLSLVKTFQTKNDRREQMLQSDLNHINGIFGDFIVWVWELHILPQPTFIEQFVFNVTGT